MTHLVLIAYFTNSYFKFQVQQKAAVGARAGQVRHKDNLTVDKDSRFESRREDTFVVGERAEVRRHQDNLKMEGEFAKREQTGYKVGEREKDGTGSFALSDTYLQFEKGPFYSVIQPWIDWLIISIFKFE